MRIAIVGAGALGCLFGCLLNEAGQNVVLVERNRKTVRMIKSKGIWLRNEHNNERNVKVDITISQRLQGPLDLLLLFVKSYDTQAAINCTQHAIGPKTLVGSFQNGLGNVEAIAQVVPTERIFCGSLAYSSMQLDDTHILYTGGSGKLRLAKYDGQMTANFFDAMEIFRATGFPIKVLSDYESSLWNKLIMNAAANPLSVITGLSCGELVRDENLREIMALVAQEVAAVAMRKGISIDHPEAPAQPLFLALEAIGANKTTMLQDLERGARTEVAAINGAVVREGEQLGVGVPVNRLLWRLVEYVEAKSQKRGVTDDARL